MNEREEHAAAIAVPPGEGLTIEGPAGGPLTFKGAWRADERELDGARERHRARRWSAWLHRHANEDEAWYVLEGELRFRLGEQIAAAPAGTFVFVPRGTAHCFQNAGDTTARILVLFTPSGMERFFDRFADLTAGAVDPGAFRRIGGDVGMEVLGLPLAQHGVGVAGENSGTLLFPCARRSGCSRTMRRKELFPPDRGLQARMIVALVTAALSAVVAIALVAWLVIAVSWWLAVIVVAFAADGFRARPDKHRPRTPATHPRERKVRRLIDRLATVADMPVPRLAVVGDDAPQIWTTARPWRPPTLHVTTGLLDDCDVSELEALLAHELSHIANRDVAVMTVLAGPPSWILDGIRVVLAGASR